MALNQAARRFNQGNPGNNVLHKKLGIGTNYIEIFVVMSQYPGVNYFQIKHLSINLFIAICLFRFRFC